MAVLLAAASTSISCQEQPVEISRLTILASSDTDGYLKNCGCMGGQVGGEVRKAHLMHQERAEALKSKASDKGLPVEVIALDLGNFIDGRQNPKEMAVNRLYSEGVIRSMALLDYASVGLGHNEIVHGQQYLFEMIGQTGMSFTAANLAFTEPETGTDYSSKLNALFQAYRVITLPSGYKLGVMHVLDSEMKPSERKLRGVEIADPVESAQRILDGHRSEAQFWILTTSGIDYRGGSAKALVEMSDVSLVIGIRPTDPLETGDSGGFKLPQVIDSPFSHAKTISRTVIQFRKGGEFSLDSRQLALSVKVKNDESVTAIINEIQPLLEQLEISRTEELLKNKGPHPWYEGHETCATCHQDIFDILAKTRHVNAYESLVKKQMQKNADCVSCHVTGHGTSSGWNVLENQPEMQGVQCESCHGPGEYHAQVMIGGEIPEDLSEDGRNNMGLLEPSLKTCYECHDALNSIDFSFDTYWPKIEHP